MTTFLLIVIVMILVFGAARTGEFFLSIFVIGGTAIIVALVMSGP